MNLSRLTALSSIALLLFASASAAPQAAKIDFAGQIKPLIANRCINCHHAGALLGEVNLENRAMAFKKRSTGPILLPGRPDSSLLYRVLTLPPKNPKAMPPAGHRIPDAERELIYQWILQGADWPKGAAGVIQPSPAAAAGS